MEVWGELGGQVGWGQRYGGLGRDWGAGMEVGRSGAGGWGQRYGGMQDR